MPYRLLRIVVSVFALLLLLSFVSAGKGDDASGSLKVGPVPEDVREAFGLPPFYQKYVAIEGLPIIASEGVSDYALSEAAWIVDNVLGSRVDILEAMAAARVRIVVMAWDEYTTDLPEQSGMTPRVFWDRRARGLGGRTTSCGEENLLCYPNDPYARESLLIHEFAHSIHGFGLKAVDPTFDEQLRSAYDEAIEAGLWKGTYAGTNPGEYWAEAVQDWFDDNRENDALHNHVNTREELHEYDPRLASLCEEVFGDRAWRYRKPTLRDADECEHLAGCNSESAPRFEWRVEPLTAKPRVLFQTELGDFEVELYAEAAPKSVANFVRYVHEGYYSDGEFYRTVTPDNQPDNNVKIEVVQSRASPERADELFPPILLERTSVTGLTHLNGSVTMAREGPDTAQDEFAICIGDQPELDFGGARNPDGQGFAVVGRVVEGMDVIREIQAQPANGQSVIEPIRIQRAVRLE
jgi:cyclophilin family peptidyl-prolyl cis-trans isomerase